MCRQIFRVIVLLSLTLLTSNALFAQVPVSTPSTSGFWYSCKEFKLEDCGFADPGKLVFERDDSAVFLILQALAGKPDQGSYDHLVQHFGRAPDLDRQAGNGVRQIAWTEGDPVKKLIRAMTVFNTLDDRILSISLWRKEHYYFFWSRIPPAIFLPRFSEESESRTGLRLLKPEAGGEAVRIGLAAPFSSANFGGLAGEIERGVRLAAEEINARGGLQVGANRFPVELVIGDDKHNPAEAERIALLFAERRVAAVIGHLTRSPSLRANRTYVKQGIPVINPYVIDPMFNEEGARNIFRIATNEDRQAEVLLRFAAEELKARRVVVLYEAGPYGQRLGEAFHFGSSRFGLRQELLRVMSARSEPLGKLMAEIKEAEPDVIFYSGHDLTAIRLLMALEKAGSSAPVLAVDGACTQKIAAIGSAVQRLMCTIPGAFLAGAPLKDLFMQKYKRRFGEDSIVMAPYGYDAMIAIAAAIEQAGSVDGASVVEALRGNESYGVFGPIAFDGGGELMKGGVSLIKIERGKQTWLRNLYQSLLWTCENFPSSPPFSQREKGFSLSPGQGSTWGAAEEQ